MARGTPHKPKPSTQSKPPTQSKGNCHKCGRKGHYAKECRASAYVIELYREVQRLKNQPRKNYNFDVQPNQNLDLENYMTVRGNVIPRPDVALLDSASTHTILTDPRFFEFPKEQTSWQYCKITTMAESRDLKFREGRAKVMLPGGHTFTCAGAMFAPEAPRSLISYKDLRANDIHISTAMDRGEEMLELRRGQSLLATAAAGDEGLYKLVLQTSSPVSPTDVDEVCMAAWPAGPELINCNLAQNVSKDTMAKPDLWHRRLGHPGETVLRQMLPLVVGHNLNASDAHKTTKCTTCIRGKFSKKPSK